MTGPLVRREVTAHAPTDPVVELCAFRIGAEEYVLDLRRLREIIQPLPITPVPHAPDFVEGVMNLRGEVIPVLDVRRRLGLPPRQGGRPKILVVQVARHVLGLVVDGVSEVIRVPRSSIGAPPSLLAPGAARLFLGVCGARATRSLGGASGHRAAPAKLRLLLDVKALLTASPAELAAARAALGPRAEGEAR